MGDGAGLAGVSRLPGPSPQLLSQPRSQLCRVGRLCLLESACGPCLCVHLCPRLLAARAQELRREAEQAEAHATASAPAKMWLFHTLLCMTSKSASPPAPQGCCALSTACLSCVSGGARSPRSEKVWGRPPGDTGTPWVRPPRLGRASGLYWLLTACGFGLQSFASCSSCPLPSSCAPSPPAPTPGSPSSLCRACAQSAGGWRCPPAPQHPLVLQTFFYRQTRGLAEEGEDPVSR